MRNAPNALMAKLGYLFQKINFGYKSIIFEEDQELTHVYIVIKGEFSLRKYLDTDDMDMPSMQK
jgi:CRP-like cAMP-binding protein